MCTTKPDHYKLNKTILTSNKSWIFRVASTPEVGGGHVMRCLSIARELIKYKSVHFLLCSGGEYWIDRITCYGIKASIYTSSKSMKDLGVLIDGYGFSDLEIKSWRKQSKYMVFMDDHNMVNNYADLIISSRIDAFQDGYKNQVILQGNKYILLAPEYMNNISNNNEDVANILVSCGLQDSNNLTISILDALSKCKYSGNVNIAIGRQAPHLQEILNSINGYNFSASIVLDSNGLYDLLIQTDMVIGTGGVSLLERMALGRPSVTIIAVENQRNQSVWFENYGATIVVDPLKKQFQNNLSSMINILLKSKEKRLKMSDKGKSIVDGMGSVRVAKFLAFGES